MFDYGEKVNRAESDSTEWTTAHRTAGQRGEQVCRTMLEGAATSSP